MSGRPDPWKVALDRHIAASADTQPGGRTEGRRRALTLTTPYIVAAATGLVLLLGAGGFLGYLAWENHDRADRWRDRSVLLQELVADRTRALNRQTARLNVASETLRRARAAIAQSEQDVAALEIRQRELANEKAQVEDQRVALLGVAGRLSSCNAGLRSLLEILGDGFLASPASVAELASVCAAADDAVEGYLQRFGSP